MSQEMDIEGYRGEFRRGSRFGTTEMPLFSSKIWYREDQFWRKIEVAYLLPGSPEASKSHLGIFRGGAGGVSAEDSLEQPCDRLIIISESGENNSAMPGRQRLGLLHLLPTSQVGMHLPTSVFFGQGFRHGSVRTWRISVKNSVAR